VIHHQRVAGPQSARHLNFCFNNSFTAPGFAWPLLAFIT
jgi:hypothetical protein